MDTSQPLPKPRVLVTGASGLIGGLTLAHLADRYAFSGLSRRPVAVGHDDRRETHVGHVEPGLDREERGMQHLTVALHLPRAQIDGMQGTV